MQLAKSDWTWMFILIGDVNKKSKWVCIIIVKASSSSMTSQHFILLYLLKKVIVSCFVSPHACTIDI
jgi:hypothetical protein